MQIEIYKGHNFVKNVGGVILLILCTLSDKALYLYLVCLKISKALRVTNPFRVESRLVANVDGLTDERTEMLSQVRQKRVELLPKGIKRS